ncbi:MAG: alpha-amylase family glycosyl hydrolase [Acidimicrobiales bacterium]
MSLLETAHHDGASLHVGDPAPTLGDAVTVWLRVPDALGVDGAYVRSMRDGEPSVVEAAPDRRLRGETWWRADVVVHNPVTPYRFLLVGGEVGYGWLNGRGLVTRDVPDAHDFRLVAHDPPPEWLADAVFYQVFPDRFAPSRALDKWPPWAIPAGWDEPVRNGRDKSIQLYGGDLVGLRQRLDHLERLGVNALYLTPFFPAPSNHRYDASSFDRVDSLLGGDVALSNLTAALRDRGMRVVGDLTTNHCGRTHPWFRAAVEDANSVEAGFFTFGHHPDDYESWFGVPSLPKLNHTSRDLRRRLYEGERSVAAYWLAPPFALDGWRIDVANMTGRLGAVDVNREVAVALRRTMGAVRPDAYLLAEHGHDASRDLDGDGWHGTMNYAGFTKPMWTWLGRGAAALGLRFLGLPALVPMLGGVDVAATIDDFRATMPWRSWASSLTLLGSHDTARWSTVTGSPELALVGAGVLMGSPGVPCVFAGDEVGVGGTYGEDARRPFPWDEGRWNRRLFDGYRRLIAWRRASTALRHGGFRWVHVGDDVLVWLRESPGERVLCQAARAAHLPVTVPVDRLGEGQHLLGGPDLVGRGGVALPADGPAFHAWRLD